MPITSLKVSPTVMNINNEGTFQVKNSHTLFATVYSTQTYIFNCAEIATAGNEEQHMEVTQELADLIFSDQR